jgi:hypothetical protein
MIQLKKMDEKIKKYLVPLLISIVLVSLTFIGIIVQKGIIMQSDFNFPVEVESFVSYFLPSWNDDMSQSNIERMPRLLIYLPFIILSYLGLNTGIVLKLIILSAFISLFYFSFIFLRELSKYYYGKENEILSYMASFLICFNPAIFQFSWKTSFIVSLSVLPLLLFLTLKQNKFNYLFIPFSLLFSLAHPFILIMNIGIWQLFSLIIIDVSIKEKIIKGISYMLIFLALLSWFSVPYFANQINYESLGRSDNLKRSTIDVISDNSAFDIFLLNRDKFIYLTTKPSGDFSLLLHNLGLLFLVVLGVFSIYFFKPLLSKLMVLLYFLFSIISLGTNSFFGDIYYFIIVNLPMGWMFRSPLKFQIYQAFCIVVAFYLTSISLKKIAIKDKSFSIFLSIILAITIVSVSITGIYNANFKDLNPVELPNQYYEINNMLKLFEGDNKVLWLPRYGEQKTEWSKGHAVQPFDAKSSFKETYNMWWNKNFVAEILYTIPFVKNYYKYDSYYNYLSSLSIKYIVFHNDRMLQSDEYRLNELKNSLRLNILYENQNWYLFEIIDKIPQKIYSVNNFYYSSGNDFFDKVSPDVAVVDINEYTNQNDKVYEKYTNILMNPSFEKWDNGELLNWNINTDDFDLKKSKKSSFENFSLKISNSNEKGWSWIYSDEIELLKDKTYLLSYDIINLNTKGTHIKLQKFRNEKWEDALFLGMNLIEFDQYKNFNSVYTSNETSKFRIVLNQGWVESKGKLALTYFDNFGVYSLDENYINISYKKKSATKYDVSLKVNKSGLIVFAETFDEDWILKGQNEIIEPVKVNGMINGYLVNESGTYELIYKRQNYFILGIILSIITLFILIVYMIFSILKDGT